MLRALGLRGSKDESANLTTEQKVSQVLKQAHDFEVCLTAMDYVLDDRASEGLKLIDDKNEAIYKLATGVVHFIEFTLGFELETREKAQRTLSELENLSFKAKQYNERNRLQTSSMYPPGTEYAVTLAESTLLHALCMLLSESMLESAKALYKLRRAYHILDDLSTKILLNQKKKLNSTTTNSDTDSVISSVNASSVSLNSASTTMTTISNKFVDVPIPLNDQQKKDAKIIKNCEKVFQMRQNRFNGSNIGNDAAIKRLRSDLGLRSEVLSSSESQTSLISTINDINTSTIDEFIHSGVHLCFGILQVVLSLIPPAIGKVLSIVGFKGSREAGLKMLWKAAELRNIHGSLGLLALLVFYDGPFQFTDVDFDVPSIANEDLHQQISRQSSKPSLKKTLSRKKMELESKAQAGYGEPTLLHPGKRLEVLLLNARAIFPNSALWLSQEARMLASKGRLEEAIELMDSISDKIIQMAQLELLLIFDRAMILVFLHKYERAATDFMKLVEINAWSHALYHYLAGACYLECWRMCKTKEFCSTGKDDVDPSKESWYLEQLEKYLLDAPEQIGKKKLLAKTMPFDKYLLRKMTAVKLTSKNTHLRIADSVGTSLIHELCYFWNGYNRMPEEHLKLSINLLGYNADKDAVYNLPDKESGEPFKKITETTDQKMIRLTLQSISLRRLGQLKEGEVLLDEVLTHIVTSEGRFIKLNEDPWLYPTALYEKALFVWKREGVDGLEEVKDWLNKAISYGGDDFELSTRISMKIKAAIDRVEGL